MVDVVTKNDWRELTDLRFRHEAERRHNLRVQTVPLPADSKREREIKMKDLIEVVLPRWAEDRVKYIEDCAWAPDPQDLYGSSKKLRGLVPKSMVPVLMFDKQREFVELWAKAVDSRDKYDVLGDKTRQQAFTTIAIWLAEHDWKFLDATTIIASTYRDDYIDMGGKGQRDATSMFGRFRMFMDAFLWGFGPCFHPDEPSLLKFNQQVAPRRPTSKKDYRNLKIWQRWVRNLTGMDEAQDISHKLTRPRWTLGGVELFPGAEGNWIQGVMPGTNAARSLTGTIMISDELPAYNGALGANTDEEAYASSAPNIRVRFGWGTPPLGGGTSTLLYKRLYVDPPNPHKLTFHMHWRHNPVWMAGGGWICAACKHKNDMPPHPPPEHGDAKTCTRCEHEQRIVARVHRCRSGGDLTSPRYEAVCDGIVDRSQISAEIDGDWSGSQADLLFGDWPGTVSYATWERAETAEGLDPGHSWENPAAWILHQYDRSSMRIRCVGYWMAAQVFAEFWVPFIKRWHPRQLERSMTQFGRKAGMPFAKAFDYPKEALEMLEHVSTFPMGQVGGDKYGSHRNMADSPYDALMSWRINVLHEYTRDREELVRGGVEWASRMELDANVCDVRPPAPNGGWYPSMRATFETARPKPHQGHSLYRLDVDKKDPPYVNNAVDAHLYAVKLIIDDEIHAVVDEEGEWSVRGDNRAQTFRYYGDMTLE